MMVSPAVNAVLQPAGVRPLLGNARKLVPRVQHVLVRPAVKVHLVLGDRVLEAQRRCMKCSSSSKRVSTQAREAFPSLGGLGTTTWKRCASISFVTQQRVAEM